MSNYASYRLQSKPFKSSQALLSHIKPYPMLDYTSAYQVCSLGCWPITIFHCLGILIHASIFINVINLIAKDYDYQTLAVFTFLSKSVKKAFEIKSKQINKVWWKGGTVKFLSGKTGHRKWLSFSTVLYPSPGDAASQQSKIIIWRKWSRLHIPRLRKNCFNIDTLKTNKKKPYRHFCGLTETVNSIPPTALLW